ncbi:YkgJ family cysteine cluster protein [Novosphingobium sp.]|uniref:YkgJ family cysteine cluster protein n=1 Tax=Novosphingobium sp. TaxID=1874826 RepID=UPI0025F55EA8|nr:YkgJ family cysteine cluster protein [Novosphingobium sp.]MCC6924742.1 YkgJ family cysteine cluster protein [Novosphingobium sp.]
MTTRHFACTQCGKCCNRPPEVELGEVAGLADQFVWQVLFRQYSLPRSLADYVTPGVAREQASAEFYESRKLLGAFAAHSWNGKTRIGDKLEERTFYLTISALPLDSGTGACSALGADGRCSIYDSRPHSCRSVPLHYSRAQPYAVADFDAFIRFETHHCDSSGSAPLLIENGQIVDPAVLAARAGALQQAEADRRWKHALLRAMRTGRPGFPSLAQVEQYAGQGALSTPMQFGWDVAVESGLLSESDRDALLERQRAAADRLLANPAISDNARNLALDVRRFIGMRG